MFCGTARRCEVRRTGIAIAAAVGVCWPRLGRSRPGRRGKRKGGSDYTVPYNRRGMLFAQPIERLATLDETKKALRYLERQLQDRYDPLCVMIRGGSCAVNSWVRKHGRPVVLKTRGTHDDG